MKIVGIDPGKNGFACLIDSKLNLIKCKKIVFNKTNLLDRPQFESFLRAAEPDMIILEKVQGRGGWGATNMFNFGFIQGQIASVASLWPLVFATPQAWQAVSCRGVAGKETAKERTLAAYRQMFPKNPLVIKKSYDNNKLDAFMIALYGQISFAKITSFDFSLVEDIEESEA